MLIGVPPRARRWSSSSVADGASLGLGDRDPGRAEDPLTEPVAGLEHLDAGRLGDVGGVARASAPRARSGRTGRPSRRTRSGRACSTAASSASPTDLKPPSSSPWSRARPMSSSTGSSSVSTPADRLLADDRAGPARPACGSWRTPPAAAAGRRCARRAGAASSTVGRRRRLGGRAAGCVGLPAVAAGSRDLARSPGRSCGCRGSPAPRSTVLTRARSRTRLSGPLPLRARSSSTISASTTSSSAAVLRRPSASAPGRAGRGRRPWRAGRRSPRPASG